MPNLPPFIIDAGPALNFLASGHERLLTNAIGRQPVHAPQTVEDEVLRKARNTSKFKGAAGRWGKMKPNWIHLLSDDSQDPALRQAAQTLLATSLEVRQRDGDDLGETMVVLHAYAKAMAGETVVVIIDDGRGRAFAAKAIDRISNAKQAGTTTGGIQLTSTVPLINQRINTPDVPDRATLKSIWSDISRMDDGLPNTLPDALTNSLNWNREPRP